MAKIKIWKNRLTIWCPACKSNHQIDERWTFNGDFEKPTISPSLHLFHKGNEEENIPPYTCHSFIRDGKIQYLDDCTHKLAGKTVPMENIY